MHLGLPLGERMLNYWFDIVALANGDRMVRLRRKVPFSGYARITTGRGAMIGEVGARPEAAVGAHFVANSKSEKFGFDAEILTPRAHRRRAC